MKAHINLIKNVLKDGYTISVWDGEEWQVKRSNSSKAIVAAVDSVDEAQLRIRDNNGNVIGWALVSAAVDLDDDETIIDCSENEYMQRVCI